MKNYLKNGKQQAKFKSISYKNDILKWLNECRAEMQNLLKFDLIISQYIDVIKSLIGTYKNSISDSLTDFLLTKENYKYFSRNKDRLKVQKRRWSKASSDIHYEYCQSVPYRPVPLPPYNCRSSA